MTSVAAKSHQRPRPPLSPLRLDSISELPETQPSTYMNLGAETPTSILKPSLTPPSAITVDEWANYGLAVNTNVPARRRSWRSNSWSGSRSKGMIRFQKEELDTDCGICFEPATNPRKVLCCGQCFCFDHIMDWLSLNKICPACNTKCSPPISPSASVGRLPMTPPKSSPTTPSLKSFPTPPPSATTVSFEGYQIQYTTTLEHELLPRSFSPLSSLIIGIVSGRTPILPASLGTAIGDFLMWSALLLFISVFIPSVL
ncbi:hypothetical protein BDM02DRAFT_3115796 [Thelephora ganbajun]|uniref:Uncharacterized protein n=1 Tax=Thelephora ganbajun TaxID=370292 RepID=A0ACB6ZF42_THEGA|nr:hypothetical protein BDM02DRAFT_3115796 [Thelephora ganbajun]